jgi:hypothetical protein
MVHTKLRENWEQRYVSEYVLKYYPTDIVKYRCPLGSVPGMWVKEMGMGRAVRAYRPYRPECDAAIITADEVIVIEGKIMKVLDGLAKLPIYRMLIPESPEFYEYRNLPVRAVLVTPKEPQWEKRVAKEFDIEVVIFTPDWLKEYYQHQEQYWTAEERMKREKRRGVLEGLGYT